MSRLARKTFFIALCAICAAPCTPADSNTPRAAADLLQSLGVVTHLDYRRTPYEDLQKVQAALRYVGLNRLRDMTPHANARPYELLAAHGFRFNFVVRSETANELPATVLALESFARRFPGSMLSIEGLNEIKLWPANYRGLAGFAAGLALQCDLYAAVKRSALLKNLPVLALTLGGASAADQYQFGDMSDCADLGNAHIYFDGRLPTASWRFAIDLARLSTPRLSQSVVTETGYSSAEKTPQGVPEEVQANYLLLLIAEAWRSDVPATYIYQLVDDKLDARDWSKALGLYRFDWTPKPVAHALHHLTQALDRPGDEAISAEVVPYAIAGDARGAQTLAIRKADGSFALLVWRETSSWDEKARRIVPVAGQSLSLTISATRAQSLDLLTGERQSIAKQGNSFSVTLRERPVLIEFTLN